MYGDFDGCNNVSSAKQLSSRSTSGYYTPTNLRMASREYAADTTPKSKASQLFWTATAAEAEAWREEVGNQ
jgi:hypothetical protein